MICKWPETDLSNQMDLVGNTEDKTPDKPSDHWSFKMKRFVKC